MERERGRNGDTTKKVGRRKKEKEGENMEETEREVSNNPKGTSCDK